MDIRLDLERVKQIQRIASQLSWLECAHCGLLSTDLDLMRADKPCPNCKVADTRRGFPSLYAIMYCDMVREAFATERYEATVVLTCALLEALLEELLAGIMRSEQVPPHIIEAVFEGFQGIRRRERLFRHLTGRKLQQAIDSLQLNLPSFYKDWLSSDSGIVRIRNDFLHGQRPQIGKSHGDKAFRLALSRLRFLPDCRTSSCCTQGRTRRRMGRQLHQDYSLLDDWEIEPTAGWGNGRALLVYVVP